MKSTKRSSSTQLKKNITNTLSSVNSMPLPSITKNDLNFKDKSKLRRIQVFKRFDAILHKPSVIVDPARLDETSGIDRAKRSPADLYERDSLLMEFSVPGTTDEASANNPSLSESSLQHQDKTARPLIMSNQQQQAINLSLPAALPEIKDLDRIKWSQLVRKIKARKGTPWLHRFSHEINESNVYIPALSRQARRELRLEGNGWKRITISEEELNKSVPYYTMIFSLAAYPSIQRSMYNCHFCGLMVPVGCELIRCQYCPLVAHINCIPDIEKFIKKELSEATKKRLHSQQQHKLLKIKPLNIHADHSNTSTPFTYGQRGVHFSDSDNLDPVSPSSSSYSYSHSASLSPVVIPLNNIRPTNHNSNALLLISNNLLAEDVAWLCSFCKHEILYYNTIRKHHYENAKEEKKQLKAIIRLQSYARMIAPRIQFIKCIRGIRIFQQVIRVRNFLYHNENEKTHQRYAFRIRIHDIHMISYRPQKNTSLINASANSNHSCNNNITALVNNSSNQHHVHGSDHSNNSSNFRPSDLSQSHSQGYFYRDRFMMGFPSLKHPSIVGEIPSTMYEKLLGQSRGNHTVAIDDKEKDIVDLLSHGSNDQASSYAKSYKSVQAWPKGTLFLTVSLHEAVLDNSFGNVTNISAESRGNSMNQIYRFDLILKESGRPQRLKKQQLEKFGFDDLDPHLSDRLCKDYLSQTFTTAKPYLLIPYARAYVEVRLTVSEVSDSWPRVKVLGQAIYNLRYYLTRHKVMGQHISLEPCELNELPTQEEGGKIAFLVPRNYQAGAMSNNSKPTPSGNGLAPTGVQTSEVNINDPKTGDSTASMLSRVSSRLHLPTQASLNHIVCSSIGDGHEGYNGSYHSHHHGNNGAKKEYEHGLVTWSLISMGYSEYNQVGYMMVLNQEAISSTKKKCWCILLDRCLSVYHIIRDGNAQLKYSMDVRSSYVQLLPNDVFRVKFNTETMYFLTITAVEHESWFRKIYSQSLSHISVPYHVYIKRRHPIRGSITHKVMNEVRTGFTNQQYGGGDDEGGAANNSNILRRGYNTNSVNSNRSSSMLSRSASNSIMISANLPSSSSSMTARLPSPQQHRNSHEQLDAITKDVDQFLDHLRVKYLETPLVPPASSLTRTTSTISSNKTRELSMRNSPQTPPSLSRLPRRIVTTRVNVQQHVLQSDQHGTMLTMNVLNPSPTSIMDGSSLDRNGDFRPSQYLADLQSRRSELMDGEEDDSSSTGSSSIDDDKQGYEAQSKKYNEQQDESATKMLDKLSSSICHARGLFN